MSRSNPIPGTLERVPGYPTTLVIYKCERSRFYQARAHVGLLVNRSMRTDVRAHAVKRAKDFYQELIGRKSRGEPVTESRANFNLVAESLFKEDQGRVDRGERKQSMVDDAKYIYKADLLDFFGSSHVKNINYEKLNEYIAHLKKERGEKPVGSKTVKNHLIVISKILKHANKMSLIDKLPVFPKIVAADNPREWLDDEQYELLVTVTDQEIGKKEKVWFNTITVQMRYLIEFTANSYLRPPDLKSLRHRQIQKVKNYLRIAAMTKVKPSPVVTQPKAAEIYGKLLELNKGHTEPDDYVFFPEMKGRDHAMKLMNLMFNHVLKKAGLKSGPNGVARTLYSLRHTCIMNTLLKAKNVDLLTLARNCRTSVDMIERFYASGLTAEMNIHKLQIPESEVFKVDTSQYEGLIIKTA